MEINNSFIMKYSYLIFLFLSSEYLQDVLALSTVARSNNALNVKLYKEVTKDNNDNVVYSPYSLQSILALVSLGANADTENQIKNALKLNVTDDEIKQAFREVTKKFQNEQNITINSASRAYLADGFEFEPKFVELVEDVFSTGFENINFNKSKESTKNINSWVEKETHGKIEDLMSEHPWNVLKRFELLNTLYFRGKWLHPFNENATEKRDFYKSKTEKVQVDTMNLAGDFELMKLPELEAALLKLPFADKKAEFIIVLPDEIDRLPLVEENYEQIWMHNNYTKMHLNVHLPKFRVESSIDMIPILKKLGITNLIEKANLSGIAKDDTHVPTLTQKTFIEVNENGVEAASATSAIGEATSLHHYKITAELIEVNHPFSFCILYDNVCIISSRVTNP